MISNMQAILKIDNGSYEINNLTEYGFEVPLDLAVNELASAHLVLGQRSIPVQFKVRRKQGDQAYCTFSDFAINDREVVTKYLDVKNRGGTGEGSLENRTYDELAQGLTGSETQAAVTEEEEVSAPSDRQGIKMLATMIMLFTMLGLAVIAVVFVKSRSNLTVGNSALVGNYLPINAQVAGEIREVLVNEGDFVHEGDELVRLHNPEMEMINEQLSAQLKTSKAKINAFENQLKSFQSKLKLAGQKLALDFEVAQSELKAATKARDSAKAAADRLKPYVDSGAITRLEFEEFALRLQSEEANVLACKNELQQVKFSQDAASADLIILGDRLDDEKSRIVSELAIAQAERDEILHNYKISKQRSSELMIKAPRDGRVYVTYRQVGEYVKMADEVVALSYPGKTWAAGQVISSQAGRVLPGQPVSINIPSLKMKLDGTVSAVGHRAMYSQGHYTAEFRGATATDVPVKVHIENLPEDIPSGLRLEMAINTGFGIDWLDELMGYELNQIGKVSPVDSRVAKSSSPKSDGPKLSSENNSATNVAVTANSEDGVQTQPVAHVFQNGKN